MISTQGRSFAVIGIGAALLIASPVALAGDEVPFDVADVYFELNDTDGDLGIHALIDGGPWRTMAIETPDEAYELGILVKGGFRDQGMTELFFESAEPTFDEQPPEVFFARFPEGLYDVEGRSIDDEVLESTARITHLIPAPADNFRISGVLVPDGCDDEPLTEVSLPLSVSWDPVTLSHPELGRTNEPIEVVRYEVVVEREEPELIEITYVLPPDVTSLTLPDGLFASGEEIKIGLLAREESGNQTGIESCVDVE